MRSRRSAAIALAICAALIVPATASAGLLTGLLGGDGILGSTLYEVDDLVDNLLSGRTALSADNCTEPALSQPFADVGDRHDYFLVDGGDFSAAGFGWQFDDGGIGTGIASLPWSGAVAVSPKVCVGDNEPTIRFRYRSRSSSARLRIDALFLGTRGELRSDYVTTISGARAWGASPVIELGTNYRAAPGAKTAIALVFTVQGGAWDLDDIYVDPFRSR
jgi:hypothetical protein